MVRKDIDPNLRMKSSLKNGVASKDGVDAFILALKDIIETYVSENPDDPNRGTYIPEYLRDNVSVFNALIIEDIIKRVVKTYLTEYTIKENEIHVRPDRTSSEYICTIPVYAGALTGTDRNLTIILEAKR